MSSKRFTYILMAGGLEKSFIITSGWFGFKTALRLLKIIMWTDQNASFAKLRFSNKIVLRAVIWEYLHMRHYLSVLSLTNVHIADIVLTFNLFYLERWFSQKACGGHIIAISPRRNWYWKCAKRERRKEKYSRRYIHIDSNWKKQLYQNNTIFCDTWETYRCVHGVELRRLEVLRMYKAESIGCYYTII